MRGHAYVTEQSFSPPYVPKSITPAPLSRRHVGGVEAIEMHSPF